MSTSNASTLLTSKPFIKQILLADDDDDDCLIFEEALAELHLSTQFSSVNNGEKLMQLLTDSEQLPDFIFLDMNMPRKNGLQCLAEIKAIENLKNIPVIILSTSFERNMMATLYQNGAQLCLRKPNEFAQLKEAINTALSLAEQAFAFNKAAVEFYPSDKVYALANTP